MTVIFGEVAYAFVRIEEDIFVPVVADTFDGDAAALEADDFIIHTAKFAPRSQRNKRSRLSGNGFEFLQDLKTWIFRVQDGVATFANHGFGVPQGTKRDGRATLWAIQCFRLWLWWIREWRRAGAHHQPSKLRRFLSLRSSNSINSPR